MIEVRRGEELVTVDGPRRMRAGAAERIAYAITDEVPRRRADILQRARTKEGIEEVRYMATYYDGAWWGPEGKSGGLDCEKLSEARWVA